MAIGDYRYRIPGGANEPEVTMRGMVKFDIWVEVQTEENPDTWALVDGGHFTELIPGAALEQAQNSGQVLAYIEQQIAAKGLVQSDRAKRALYALLPNGIWPVDDIIRSITLD